MLAARTDSPNRPANRGSDDTDDLPFLVGGPLLRTSPHGVIAVAVTLVVALLPVPGLFRVPGAPMEEGFMLYFPELVTRGEVPNVDFLHLYGPGSLHVLAGWYEVFGFSLWAERAFGLVQNLAIIAALYVVGRLWGRAAAVGMAVAGTLIITPASGLVAMAWHGGVALGLWTVIFVVRARSTAGRSATINWGIAGVLAGMALSFRPDLVIAIGLALAVGVWRDRRSAWRPVAVGAAVGLIPMWVHLVMAGPSAAIQGMVLDPVFKLRDGRTLPAPPPWDELQGALQRTIEAFPPWWDLPAIGAAKQIYVWFWAMLLFGVGIPAYAWWRRRRGDTRVENVTLLVAGLFGLGVVGQGLQRPDSVHLAWATIASVPLLVPIVTEMLSARIRRPLHLVAGGAGVAVLGLLFVVAPFYTYRPYVNAARISVGALPGGHRVENAGRMFYDPSEERASWYERALRDLEQWSKPGQTLIVGPHDLSRTAYSESMLYWLIPKLEPGTKYVEMDPGVADTEDSGLAEEVAEADWVLLTTYWAGWEEPNASTQHHSQKANQVIADQFCLVAKYALSSAIRDKNAILLYQNCGSGNGSGVSPADIDLRTPTVPLVRD